MTVDTVQLTRSASEFAGTAEQFARAPGPAVQERLRSLRGEIVTALLEQPAAVEPQIAGLLPGIVKTCLQSGLRIFPRTQSDEQLYARCVEGMSSRLGPAGLAALLMSWHACELSFVPPFDLIPPELRAPWATMLLEMPPTFIRPGDAERFVHYLEKLCASLYAQLATAPAEIADPLAAAFLASPIFLQCYFNELNLRPLMRARAACIERVLIKRGSVLEQLRVLRPHRTRPRIGFVTMHLYDGTETVFLAAHLERLDRRRYEVRLYSGADPKSFTGALCRASAEVYTPLPKTATAAVARLRQDDLDIAVFCNNLTVAVHQLTEIAAHRVAPIQVTTSVSPVTTGLSNVDYLMSGQANETADAEAHHSERLLRIAVAADCYPFQYVTAGQAAPSPISRAGMAIPDDAVLFFSATNYYKIVPELSQAWIEILLQVPNSYLLLMPFNPNWSPSYPWHALNIRLLTQAQSAGVALHKIRIQAAVPTILHLHAIMQLADVYLDSFPFTGACSLYDPLALGLPIVARSGSVSRSRHSVAILQMIGASDWVATDQAGYVARAVELGRSADRRRADRDRIARARDQGLKLMDTADYAARLMPMLDSMLSDWNAHVASGHQAGPETLIELITKRAAQFSQQRRFFTDFDLVTTVVLPYLGSRGSRRMLDIGACMGAITQPFLEQGWQSTLFEPDERCHATLSALLNSFPGQARLERVKADSVARYICQHGLFDLDFIKIKAEGHDFDILHGIDFSQVSPRLLMVEFNEQFPGHDRSSIGSELVLMRDCGYRACVVGLQAAGSAAQQDRRTRLLAIGIDGVEPFATGAPFLGNILFFRQEDSDFLPSLNDWLSRAGAWHD